MASATSVVVATSEGLVVLDVETGQVALRLSDENLGVCSCVRAIPQRNLLVAGHMDGKVGLWDVRTGSVSNSFVAHTESVACLDATNSHIATGSSEAVRLWDLTASSCINDFVAHRKKFDEGVTTIRFNSQGSSFVSGGGDGVAKVFSQ